MATYSHVFDSDSGLVARNKINDMIDHINTNPGGGGQGPTGPQGPQGDPGPQGPQGESETALPFINITGTTWDYSLGYNATMTISSNQSLTITNVSNGDYGTLIVKQGSATKSSLTLNGKFPYPIEFSEGIGSVDIFTWVYDGTDFYWNYNNKFI